MTDICKWSACEVVAQLQSGGISAHDALDSLEKRILSVDPKINALPTLCFERARNNVDADVDADAITGTKRTPHQRGLLHGLP